MYATSPFLLQLPTVFGGRKLFALPLQSKGIRYWILVLTEMELLIYNSNFQHIMNTSNFTLSDYKHIKSIIGSAIFTAANKLNTKALRYDIEEITSISFEKIIKLWDVYDKDRSESAWFWTISYRCALDYLTEKFKRNDKCPSIDTSIDSLLPDYCQADGALISREEIHRIEERLTAIGGNQEKALRLCADGYTYEEIQQRLDCTYSSLRTMISRGRKVLKIIS
jgi:RNA polymerase sigma factor (sigma-70 family)